LNFGGGYVASVSENRYEHIYVRLAPAIHGRRHFLKPIPHSRLRLQTGCCLLAVLLFL